MNCDYCAFKSNSLVELTAHIHFEHKQLFG